VIFFEVTGPAAKLAWGAENNTREIIIDPQMHLLSFLLVSMTLPFFCIQYGFT
jgi:hypothetical protein